MHTGFSDFLVSTFKGKKVTRLSDRKTVTKVSSATFGQGGGFVKRDGVFLEDDKGRKLFLDLHSDEFTVS